MRVRIHLATAAALALAACGGNTADEGALANDAALDTDTMMPADADLAGAALPATGADYVATVAPSDMYEIESGRLAGTNAESADVKALAQMIVTDHEKSSADLKAAASQAEPALTLPAGMNPEQQANMKALQSASGAEFDRTFLEQQVAAHQKALAAVQAYAANGEVPALKQHASTVAGPIERHLQRAQELLAATGGAAGQQ